MLRLDSSASLKLPSPPSSHQPNPKKEKLSSPPPLFPDFSKITPLPHLPKSGRPTRTHNSLTSSSSGDDDSTPNTKRRLKRIKDRFRVMTLWFEQVMLEDGDDDDDVTPVEEEKAATENQEEEDKVEEEEEVQVINAEPTDDENVQGLEITAVTKEDCDQKRFEESVNVEKIGECIVIHVSCHCGVPYQFLLAGGNCYYKLM